MNEFYQNVSDIAYWLKEHNVENYTINEDLSVNVRGDVRLGAKKIERFPFQFHKVEGDFNCCTNLLTSLKGSPRYVGSGFGCYRNNLISFEYAPLYVKDIFTATIVPVLDLSPLLHTQLGTTIWLNHPDKLKAPGFEEYYKEGYVNQTHINNNLHLDGPTLHALIEKQLLKERTQVSFSPTLKKTVKI